MSSSLATFILLSCHLISSSASSLEEIKLSLAASYLTRNLTGYLVVGFDKDTSCSDPAYYSVRPLNTCYPTSSSSYAITTAYSTIYFVDEFFDSLCTIHSDIKFCGYSNGLCFDRNKTYVQATSTVTSSTAMISIR